MVLPGFSPPSSFRQNLPHDALARLAIFQLVDYAVHGWDIRQGTDAPHGLGGDSADLLVPLMFVL